MFNFNKAVGAIEGLQKFLSEHHSSFNKETLAWVDDIAQKIKGLQEVGNKFENQLRQLFMNFNKDVVNERVKKAAVHFSGILNGLLETIPRSPAITDSRNYAKEYFTELTSTYSELFAKNKLINTAASGFDLEVYQLQKSVIRVPLLTVNAYSGSSPNKRTNSPHPILHRQLMDLRDEIVAKDNLPIFFVAGTSTIDEMAKFLPLTPKDLMKIKGFGEKKVEKYGQQFLSIIQAYATEKGLVSHIEEKDTNEKGEHETNRESTQGKTLKLYLEGISIPEIAKQRNFAISTIEGHLAQLVKSNEVDVYKLLSEEKINAIVKAIETIETDAATPLLEYLGSDYTYSELRFGINYSRWLKEKLLTQS